MLEGLIWTVLVFLVFTVAILSVPVDLMARLDFGERTRFSIRIGWLFGLVRLRHDIGPRKPRRSKKPKSRKQKRDRPLTRLPVAKRGFRLLGELLARVRIRYAEIDLSVGTDDPAMTGELVGFAAPIVTLANALPRTSVTLTPDFAETAVRGMGMGEIRLVPITLVPPIIGFALSPEARQWLLARS